MEEIEFIIDETKESMNGSVEHLEKSFLNIRAVKASPQMLGIVFVLIAAPLVGKITDWSGTFSTAFISLGIFAAIACLISLKINNNPTV